MSMLGGRLWFLFLPLEPLAVSLMIVSIGLLIGLFILLTFGPHRIVNWLKLDQGFDDEKLDFGKMDTRQVIKIGTFIVGGLLLLEHFPSFLLQTIFAFKTSLIGQQIEDQDNMIWLSNGLKILIGYLLLTNLDFVASRLGFGRDKNESSSI